jgi:glucose/mannose-6-phosphate isomerase
MMEDTLRRFGEQFTWHPVVEGGELPHAGNYIVVGMGGSHLGAWLIQHYGGVSTIIIHRDYGLPHVSDAVLRDSVIILSSYSGTTEEVLDAAHIVVERGLRAVAISTGGALIPFAQEHAIPFVRIPSAGLEPRMAIGYAMLGIAHLMDNDALEESIRTVGAHIDPMEGKDAGAQIAAALVNTIPVIYASTANYPLAYIWKIKYNETAKIPAFCDAVPEMCHNELNGYDPVDTTRAISRGLHVIMLEDTADHPRITKRMHIITDMLRERGYSCEHIALTGEGFSKAFRAALLADWVSFALAEQYGVPNPETPMIAEFKKRMD